MPRAGLDTHSLIVAAAELADAHGVEEITLSAVASRLGVRPPSLYNHITGLPGLRTLLAIHGLELLYGEMSAAAEGLNGDEAVHALSHAVVNFARRRPGLYETTLKAPGQEDSAHIAISEKVLALLVQVLSYYELGEEGSLHAVRGLRSILHGFTALENQGGFGMPLDLNVSLTRLIRSYLAGIYCMREDRVSEL